MTSTLTLPELVLATSNEGKIAELRELLGESIRVRGMHDFDVEPAEETGSTFEENAVLKAEAIAAQTGLPALADDSGLVVDALGGAPGVYSARYAGPQHDDADNRALLLQEMATFGVGFRDCRFVCVVALAVPNRATITTRGTVEGSVGFTEIGTHGFGYDSLFVLPDGRTMAQLESDEKNAISHRGTAMREMLRYLISAVDGDTP